MILSSIVVRCDCPKQPTMHKVTAYVEWDGFNFVVSVYETFGEFLPNTQWRVDHVKKVMSLKPVLEDAVKLAGRLAKNAGIDESGLTQALSQAYVAAVTADRERLANEQIGALFTDSPCQES